MPLSDIGNGNYVTNTDAVIFDDSFSNNNNTREVVDKLRADE